MLGLDQEVERAQASVDRAVGEDDAFAGAGWGARVDAIGAAVGAAARIRADANQGYDRERALDFARRVRPDAIEAFEQPLPADDWTGLAEVARTVDQEGRRKKRFAATGRAADKRRATGRYPAECQVIEARNAGRGF